MRCGWSRLFAICGCLPSCIWPADNCDSSPVLLVQGSFTPYAAPTDALLAGEVTVTDTEVTVRYTAADGSEIVVVYVLGEQTER